jgi:hypothetical protein
LFAEKLEAVVELYLSPPQHAIVLCVDEKSQVQALVAIPVQAEQDSGVKANSIPG